MSPIERNETYTKWEQDAITMLLLHLCALLICLYLGEMGYAKDTAPVIFVLAVFLTGFFTNGYLWSLLGSLLSVFVVNYFFTEPFSKLSFSGPGYPITFVTLFVVGILTSAMTVRSRDQQRLRAENEKERTRGNLLRAVSHDLRTPPYGHFRGHQYRAGAAGYPAAREAAGAAAKRRGGIGVAHPHGGKPPDDHPAER